MLESGSQLKNLSFFSCIAYFLWGQSNKVIHEGIVSNPIVVVQQASKLLNDYRDALVIRGIYGQVDGRVAAERISQDHVWMPPGEGFMKVNWDLACNSQSQSWHMGF